MTLTGAERSKRWREAHPERARNAVMQWRKRNQKHIAAQAKRWRQKNPERAQQLSREAYWRDVEKARRTARRSYYKLRSEVIAALGGVCVGCGNTDIRVLQVNHRSGGGIRELENGKADNLYRAIRNRTTDLSRFDVRCANCNIVFEYETGRRLSKS